MAASRRVAALKPLSPSPSMKAWSSGCAVRLQEGDTLVLEPRAHDEDRVGPSAINETAIGFHLGGGARRGQEHQVEPVLRETLAACRENV
jgi:hypothetical protein